MWSAITSSACGDSAPPEMTKRPSEFGTGRATRAKGDPPEYRVDHHLAAPWPVRPSGQVGDHEVRSPFHGTVKGLLAVAGERLTRSQPIAWLRTA